VATVLSSDAKIYYEVHGSGPAVLFVHGSGGHHAAWWQQVAALSPSYSVITVDLRGFGNSRWESAHDARNFPGDIIAVLDAIATDGGPSRAVLVGQSIGAAAALRAALDRPDRASGRSGPTWRSCSGRWARSTRPRCRTCGTSTPTVLRSRSWPARRSR
jgi:3-oxoadipate enol-lactonase